MDGPGAVLTHTNGQQTDCLGETLTVFCHKMINIMHSWAIHWLA